MKTMEDGPADGWTWTMERRSKGALGQFMEWEPCADVVAQIEKVGDVWEWRVYETIGGFVPVSNGTVDDRMGALRAGHTAAYAFVHESSGGTHGQLRDWVARSDGITRSRRRRPPACGRPAGEAS